MDKIILVHYINVGNMPATKARQALAAYVAAYKNTQENEILNYWIPSHENKIECIYPVAHTVSSITKGPALSAALTAALAPFINENNTSDTRLKISKVIESVLLAFGVKPPDVYIDEQNI